MIRKSIAIILLIIFSVIIIKNIPKKEIVNTFSNSVITYPTKIVIDKISLEQRLYLDSKLNNVNINVQILTSSTFPSDKESHIYLAGHNGNTNKSFFKNLDKLVINDLIKLYYKDKIYSYELVKKEVHNKIGTLILDKVNYDSLTLITCTKNSRKTQDVYTAKLVKVS